MDEVHFSLLSGLLEPSVNGRNTNDVDYSSILKEKGSLFNFVLHITGSIADQQKTPASLTESQMGEGVNNESPGFSTMLSSSEISSQISLDDGTSSSKCRSKSMLFNGARANSTDLVESSKDSSGMASFVHKMFKSSNRGDGAGSTSSFIVDDAGITAGLNVSGIPSSGTDGRKKSIFRKRKGSDPVFTSNFPTPPISNDFMQSSFQEGKMNSIDSSNKSSAGLSPPFNPGAILTPTTMRPKALTSSSIKKSNLKDVSVSSLPEKKQSTAIHSAGKSFGNVKSEFRVPPPVINLPPPQGSVRPAKSSASREENVFVYFPPTERDPPIVKAVEKPTKPVFVLQSGLSKKDAPVFTTYSTESLNGNQKSKPVFVLQSGLKKDDTPTFITKSLNASNNALSVSTSSLSAGSNVVKDTKSSTTKSNESSVGHSTRPPSIIDPILSITSEFKGPMKPKTAARRKFIHIYCILKPFCF